MWGNLGISLFGPLTGALVATTTGSVPLAIAAIIVGCALGATLLGASAVFGATTGAPAMVSMRGMLGRRGSVLPTLLNIAQNIGWATMEIIVIATAAVAILGPAWRWPFVIFAGAAATLMAVRPLGSVRLLRKVMVWLVLAASVFLFVQVLMQPRQAIPQDSVLGFWPAVDLAIAGVISYAALAPDYSRHSRNRRDALLGRLPRLRPGRGRLLHPRCLRRRQPRRGRRDHRADHPAGRGDRDRASCWSTRWTRRSPTSTRPPCRCRTCSRGWTGGSSRSTIGVIATLLAGMLDFSQYQSFLFLIGSVFVPLFAVAAVDFFAVSGQRWDVSDRARIRVAPVDRLGLRLRRVPAGLSGYRAGLGGLLDRRGGHDRVHGPEWLGSSVAAILVGGLVMLVLGRAARRPRGGLWTHRFMTSAQVSV